MEVPKLVEVSDLLYRRVGDNLTSDLVKEVYAQYEKSSVKLIFVLGCSLNVNALTSLSVRYNHYFSDMHPTVKIKVLTQPNYFKPDSNSYIIWTYSSGFTIPKSYGG